MIYELNHLGIVAQDLAASERFYTELLGAREAWRARVDEAGMTILYLQLSTGLVELIGVDGGGAQGGANHLGFLTDDLEGDYAALLAAGAERVTAPRDTATGVGRQALVLDPNGVRIELLQRDLPLREAPLPHPHVVAIDHVALQADDHDATVAFYTGLLGLTVAKQVEIPSHGTTLSYLRSGEDVVEVLPLVHGGARLHHIALRVDDADAMHAHLVALGGAPDDVRPAAGEGRLGSITDPDGVVIEFVDRDRVLTV